jgi:hypothetical protein
MSDPSHTAENDAPPRRAVVTAMEERAVEAVAEWLAAREGSHAFIGRGALNARAAYRRRAAALLTGEAWAINATWEPRVIPPGVTP